jgi:hypothetical protein
MGSSNLFEVTVGESNVGAAASSASATRHTIEAKKLLKHSLYDPTTKANDIIALVYLPSNAVKSANVAIGYTYMQDPSEPTVFTASFYNRQSTVVGWGQLGNSGGYSSILRLGSGTIVNLATCQGTYPSVTAKQICTQPSPTNPQVIVSYFI